MNAAAVLISDIHFTPANLEIASQALRSARDKAEELRVPLVICGDTLDSKAIIRGEAANRLIELLKAVSTDVFILVGNHDLLNEKSKAHSLNFLKPYCKVVDSWLFVSGLGHLISYQSDPEDLKKILSEIPKGSQIIAHQGVATAFMGHYVQDKSSLPKEAFADFRVISGHYHRAQDIVCGRPRKGAIGLFSYVGSPYTQSFAEAEDGPKGYQILSRDGLLTQVPLNLRKHVVIEMNQDGEWTKQDLREDDLVWVKLHGSQLELDKIKKKDIAEKLIGHPNFKLDKICTDNALQTKINKMTELEILDALIDGTSETPEHKSNLKKLWREICASSTAK